MKRFVVVLFLLLAGVASADGLLQNTTPAERARGCSFADHFRSQAEVEANGATVTGAPTFAVGSGVTLNGTTDYLTYNLCGMEFNSDSISFAMEFTPDFDHDEDAFRTFFDSTAGNRYYMYKANNAGGNELILYFGNAIIGGVLEATYSPSWVVGERHILVVSGTTGSTDAWLINATGGVTQIFTANATAWTAKTPTSLYVGSTNAGGNKFDGTIHSLQVYRGAKLTAQEAQDFYDNTTYSYMNQATAVYSMDMVSHDPTNHRTLDSSGNNNHWLLGNGVGVGEPTKLTHKDGYSFDGVNDHFSSSPAATTVETEVYVWEQKGEYESGRSVVGFLETSGGYTGEVEWLGLFPQRLTQLQMYDLSIRLHQSTYSVAGQTILYTDQSALNMVTVKFQVPAGNGLEIHWGDGTSTTVVCNNVLNTYTHNYTATGQYAIRVVGDYDAITRLDAFAQAWIYGDIANLAGLTNLVYLYLHTTSVSGDIANLAGLTNLIYLGLHTTSVSGDIANLAGLTNLVYLYLYTTSVSGDIANLAGLTNLVNLYLFTTSCNQYTSTPLPAWPGCNQQIYSMGLDSTEVDNWLIDLANGVGVNGTLNIAGTNAARTAASNAAKAALLAAGWAVTVNE